MERQKNGNIKLCGSDAIHFANMFYRPTKEELLYNKTILEQIDKKIKINEIDNGYEAEIEDLDLSFLEEKKTQHSLNIKSTFILKTSKENIFYANSNTEKQAQMIVETKKTSTYENTSSNRMILGAA